MRAADIVAQFQKELPKRTGLFTNNIPVISLTRSGSTVTAITGAAHGLSNGQEVVITGAVEANPITSLTFADGLVTGIVQNKHDLTIPTWQMINAGNLYEFNYATISGVTGPDADKYNGRFLISSSINRKTFQYAPENDPAGSPAPGSPILEQEGGYNGKFPVTVIDPTTFTYEILSTPESPAQGTIIARSPARISSAFSIERALRSYTEKGSNKLWVFVVLGDVTISKNRAILSDASTENSGGTEYRDRLIEPFRVYVFVPAVSSLSGRDLRDDMEAIRGLIYHSVLGVIFPSGLAEEPWSQTSAIGDRYAAEISSDAVYIHEFSFSRVVDVIYLDTIGPDTNRALRDFDIGITTDLGTGELTAGINLDEQPL